MFIEGPHRPSILLAEDDPDQSDMLREILEDEGYAIETAFSGDVALRKLQQRRYDLIILDIRMPGLYGSEVLRILRQEERNRTSPVVVVSAFASASELQRYQQDGAQASFAKPYALTELLDAIARLAPKAKPGGAP